MKKINKKKDIFDRIMEFSCFKWFYPFYSSHKEGLLYLFFGGCTFFIGIISFAFCVYSLGMEEIASNNVSWCIAVAFAYITNRTWVFSDKSNTALGIIREFVSFAIGRLVTLFLENAIIWLFVNIFMVHTMITKFIGQIVVIITNYLISKFFVFKKDKISG